MTIEKFKEIFFEALKADPPKIATDGTLDGSFDDWLEQHFTEEEAYSLVAYENQVGEERSDEEIRNLFAAAGLPRPVSL